MVSPNAVSFFNGFGPNNFAYNQSLRADGGVYRNLFGLHDGLDFGIPHGTPLRAMDWGLVVHASRQANDTPFGARPFSVAVIYGKYLALYGHMSDSSIVKAGDIVAPGQKIGLSGTDPDDGPHLHFEMRELGSTFLQELKTQLDMNGLEAAVSTLDPNTVRARIRVFTNPARFFTVRLETHHWSSGQPLPSLDHDNNGYPDQVVRAGDTQPTAFDLYWLPSYPPKRGSFWEGSHIA
jgi:murein DD-endopeptidase MepM/ murein hydrolase activator NlpD